MRDLDPMPAAEVRRIREKCGLTQDQLGTYLKLRGKQPRRTIAYWESGEQPITGPAEMTLRYMDRFGLLSGDTAARTMRSRPRPVSDTGKTTKATQRPPEPPQSASDEA